MKKWLIRFLMGVNPERIIANQLRDDINNLIKEQVHY